MMDAPATLEQVIERLHRLRDDTVTTLEVLESHRQQLEACRAQLEHPRDVDDYIAFFAEQLGRAFAECERVARELPTGIAARHLDDLRQIASRSAADEHRCLRFRDTCINRPLPHETVRPLLNDLSMVTRDQLLAFRDLEAVAECLEALLSGSSGAPAGTRSFDRRGLFKRLFKPTATPS